MKRLISANMSGRGALMGLERMQAYARCLRLFEGEYATKFIHVAGTNGKGTVCHKICAGLDHYGKRFGLYTSPHVGTYRERILVNGKMICEDEAESLLEEIDRHRSTVGEEASYFELLTLLAFVHFERSKLDVAVIEAGLGGLLDATNIIPKPTVCVITSIGLDHQDFLGPTEADIARAKGGIFKPGAHVVIGPSARPVELLSSMASACGAASFTQVQLPQGGVDVDIDVENSLIAQTALQRIGVDIPLSTLEGIRPFGRFEQFILDGTPVVLDGAHNPDAMRILGKGLRKNYENAMYHIIVAMSSNKDVKASLAELFNEVGTRRSYVYATRSDNESRSLNPDVIVQVCKALSLENDSVSMWKSATVAFDAAMDAVQRRRSDGEDTLQVIVVCGSFNTLGKVRHERLQKDMVLDPVNMNENKL